MSSASVTQSSPHASITRPNSVQVGTIVWLGSEVMFFAGLFAVFFTLRSVAPELWAEQSAKLDIVYAGINTAILVLSSVTAQMGVFAAENKHGFSGGRRSGKWYELRKWGVVEWFFLSFVLGAIFIVGQVYEYGNLITEGIGFQSDSFGSVFYFATGFHGLHVTGGLIAMLMVIGRVYASKRFTHREAISTIAVSYYWHFVDVVWIALFFAVYVLPRIS